ncbi:MAG: protein phosphatase 2C domain-containing protein [Acidobacteria bacterium]|nr:protein phosphatase 2C domain-containing protein [Acidobacteriota bacterium]
MSPESILDAWSFRHGRLAVVSDRGLNPKRELNEDDFLILEEQGLFAVADGVGGQNAGEVASRTAMEILRTHLPARARGDRAKVLERLVRYANRTLYEAALTETAYAGMATTVAMVWFDRETVTICHVGDSRVYRLSGNRLHRETVDHSLAEETSGERGPSLENLPRYLITRALGVEPEVKPDLKQTTVEPGTVFLLCTDGITRHLSDGELETVFTRESDPLKICQQIKERCYERGAKDNLTAIVVEWDTTGRMRGEAADASNRPRPDRRIEVTLGSKNDRVSGRQRDDERLRPELPPLAAHLDAGELPPRSWMATTGLKALAGTGVIALSLLAGAYFGSNWRGLRPTPPSIAVPDQSESLFESGVRHYRARRFAEAERDFQAAVSGAPNHGPYSHWLGKTSMMQGRYAAAAKAFERAAELTGDPDNYLYASAAYSAQGDYALAKTALEAYRRQAPLRSP